MRSEIGGRLLLGRVDSKDTQSEQSFMIKVSFVVFAFIDAVLTLIIGLTKATSQVFARVGRAAVAQ